MINRIQNGIKRRFRKLLTQPYNKTYSQSGEDLILETMLAAMKIKTPHYLDVGANDPMWLNNTYFFYSRGANGVLIEPNPSLSRRLAKKRPRDKVLTCGIGTTAIADANFFVLSPNSLSTFSEKEAQLACMTPGIRIVETIKIPNMTLELLVKQEFADRSLDLLSLDVEGLDEMIVLNTDWEKVRPAIICVETREFSADFTGKRVDSISHKLIGAGYRLAGLTFYNSIFVDHRRLPNL